MTYANDLRALSATLRDAASALDGSAQKPLELVEEAANELADCWSGSSLGFHSRVYHEAFTPPPPGAHFDREWGFLGRFQGTTGNWQEFSIEDIQEEIRKISKGVSLGDAKKEAEKAAEIFREGWSEAVSILSSFLEFVTDDYILNIKGQVEALKLPTAHSLAIAQLPQGQVMSRDSTAVSQGLQVAEHQRVWAEVAAIRGTFKMCRDLSFLLDRSANHIDRRSQAPAISTRQAGERVFIGHGRSPLWRELKDFVSDRLKLPYEEFNRVPVAGVTTVARISEMLDRAAFVFLVMTAEDEVSDGNVRARQNVIHEVGLFQGRLGFERAIVLLEEGCEDFSNINGLSQIRFPRGNIAAKFEDVRMVLEREGLLEN
ncbi:TIR domain-containing protein [Streptomyces coelicoflavus]|uniref:TIR domain-containing protein n=1 Tax=Streptomyces coelicoflavus TaxID=285562 RepID=UPI00369327B4